MGKDRRRTSTTHDNGGYGSGKADDWSGRILRPGRPGVYGRGMSDGAGHGMVVIAEDDPTIAALEKLYLANEGFGVHVESDGTAALTAIRRYAPTLAVLDIALPGLSGTEVCRQLRAAGDWTPVLFVTARDDVVDRVVGLELGADDYLTKPFSPRELVARIHAILRRGRRNESEPARLRSGTVTVDLRSRRVWVDDRQVTLTATEFDLLAHLLSQPGRVFGREQLLAAVWGYVAAGGTRTVDVHVAQLRAKLGAASPIRTVRGVGYAADAS